MMIARLRMVEKENVKIGGVYGHNVKKMKTVQQELIAIVVFVVLLTLQPVVRLANAAIEIMGEAPLVVAWIKEQFALLVVNLIFATLHCMKKKRNKQEKPSFQLQKMKLQTS